MNERNVSKSGEFQEGKLWFQRKGAVITLGVTNHAIEEIGDIEGVELPNEGDDFNQGDTLAVVDGTNGRLEIATPAAGMICGVNEALSALPNTVSEDPLEEGWLVKLEIQDASDLEDFLEKTEKNSHSA